MFSSHQPIGGILIYFYVCGIPFTQTCSSRCSKMPEAGPSCRQQAPTEVEMEVVEAPTSKEFRIEREVCGLFLPDLLEGS